jgi:hypothetical protein
MKIKTNTPDLLVVEERPWLLGLGIILFTLIFAAVGLFMLTDGEWMGLAFLLIGGGLGLLGFFAFVRRVQVVFFRPEGWVELRRANALRRSTVRHDLGEISRAIVETSRGENADLHRVTLEIDSGQSAGLHPLTQAYTNVGKHHAVARAINDWLSA